MAFNGEGLAVDIYYLIQKEIDSHNRMDSGIVLHLDFILLDPDIIETIVEMDASVFCAEPHSGLVSRGPAVFRGLATGW